MFGHDDERVELIAAFAAIVVHGLEEEAHIVFDDKQFAPTEG